MKSGFTLKQYAGALLFDFPVYLYALLRAIKPDSSYPWIEIRNRNESLIPAPIGLGYKCDWEWTSELYLPKHFPIFGHWLYRCSLKRSPIVLKEQPTYHAIAKPDVSFVIGHRGIERLPLLLATLQSIAGQSGCQIECIVVEQDNRQLIKDQLPDWVRYVHTPLPNNDMTYSRSWAFNVGAETAKSDFLVFHDNDLLVPATYTSELLKYYSEGYEVINLKRFIFYIDKNSTLFVCDKVNPDVSPSIVAIMQNAEGGGSIGISNQAYFDIGGFDEHFVGWGGEDSEFWERAQTRKVYPYGYLPMVHLWHAPQSGKLHRSDADGVLMYRQLSEQPVEERIRSLRDTQ